MKKIRINNSIFMELIDELATDITRYVFGEEMYESKDSTDDNYGLREDAQKFYNEKYDYYETLFNNVGNIYPIK